MEKVLRSLSDVSSSTGRTITGCAVKFESWSRDLGGFIELIHRGAITQQLIDSSDIIMNINHDEDKMVARSVNGVGTLKLDLRDDGLYFEFEAPDTNLGNELLYNIRSGNLFECSFAFTLPDNREGEKWSKSAEGYRREIFNINGLYDCSIVTHAAYGSTSCDVRYEHIDLDIIKRSLDEINSNKDMNDEKLKDLEAENARLRQELEDMKKEEANREEQVPVEPSKEDLAAENARLRQELEDLKKEESSRECGGCDKEEEPRECGECNKEEERKLNNKNIFIKDSMVEERKYSIVDEIKRSIKTGEVITVGQLNERGMSVTDEGADVVATDVFDVLPALRAKNVLTQSGAKMFTGLDKKIKVPVMAKGNVAWASELAAATDGSGSFSSVDLEPHRLTAYFPISLELLAMDSTNVESIIRQDIVKAISDKLEETVFGSSYGADQPTGLAYNATEQHVTSFSDITYIEGCVEEANFDYENAKYIVSPKFKAAMRNTVKGANANKGFIWEDNAIDGTAALSTGHVPSKKAIYGDWSNLYIGNFGNIEIETVRDSANLKKGQIEIIVNSFWDFKPVRQNAFQFAYVS